MHHPRRNEVYRDVGSELHETSDSDFVEIRDTTLEPDAALLLCSDGLTDLVPADRIQQIVSQAAGEPDRVARDLVRAANDAGGRDNVTVVYVEGEAFSGATARSTAPGRRGHTNGWMLALAALLVTSAGLFWAWRSAGTALTDGLAGLLGGSRAPESSATVLVRPGESIGAALRRAGSGGIVLVEPGEYRERLTLSGNVRLFSLTPRAATIRLPGDATDADVAVTIGGGAGGEIAGFRIVGDAATPLGTGVLVDAPGARLIDLEVVGAARAAVEIGPHDNVMVIASDIRNNPGAGLVVRAKASVRVSHSAFSGNAASPRAPGAIVIDPGASVAFENSVTPTSGGRSGPAPTRRGGNPAAAGRGRQ
jgi:hypothetical protein